MQQSFRRRRVVLCLLAAAVAGCASTQSRHEFIGESFAARPADSPVEVIRAGLPTRPYVRTARLDVHLEKTGFVTSSFEDALPELMKQARESGSDAIIEISERRSQINETMVYHVTAFGIRYTSAN